MQKYIEKYNNEVITLSFVEQERLVMSPIYEIKRKSMVSINTRKKVIKDAKIFIDKEANVIVLGCTELPLVFQNVKFASKIINSTEILAGSIIKMASGG